MGWPTKHLKTCKPLKLYENGIDENQMDDYLSYEHRNNNGCVCVGFIVLHPSVCQDQVYKS